MRANEILNPNDETSSAVEEARRAWRDRKRKSRGKEVNHDWPAQRQSLVEKFCNCKGKHVASKCEGEARVQAYEWLNVMGKLCLDLITYFIEPLNLIKPKIDEMIDIVSDVDKPGMYFLDEDAFLRNSNWQGYKERCHQLGHSWPAVGHVREYFTCLKERKPIPREFVEKIDTPIPAIALPVEPVQPKQRPVQPQPQEPQAKKHLLIGTICFLRGGTTPMRIIAVDGPAASNPLVTLEYTDGGIPCSVRYPFNSLRISAKS